MSTEPAAGHSGESTHMHDEFNLWSPDIPQYNLAAYQTIGSESPWTASGTTLPDEDWPLTTQGPPALQSFGNESIFKQVQEQILSGASSLEPGFDSLTTIPAQLGSTLKCERDDCEGLQPFTQKSAFRRHIDKHERPYKCLEIPCRGKTFPDKAGLKRHQRSVHGKPLLVCPVSTCQRHKKGFSRKDNLKEHFTRVHSMERLSSQGESQIDSLGQQGAELVESLSISSSQSSNADRPIGVSTPDLVKPNRLEAKLEELKAERARRLAALDLKSLDEDIMAVQRALDLCGPMA